MLAMTRYGFDHGHRRTFTRTAENRSRAAPAPRSTRQGTGAPARSRPPRPAARPSGPQNSPATVGPDPDTNAWSAPASRTAESAASISGHSDTAAASSWLTSNRSGRRTPWLSPDQRSGSVAANSSSLSRSPRRSASAIHLGRRQPVGQRDDHERVNGQWRARLDEIAGAGPEHETRRRADSGRPRPARPRARRPPRRRSAPGAPPSAAWPPRRPIRPPCRRRSGSACRS